MRATLGSRPVSQGSRRFRRAGHLYLHSLAYVGHLRFHWSFVVLLWSGG